MGEALIKGILAADIYKAEQIYVAEPSDNRREYLSETFHVHTSSDSQLIWQECSTVILAVKPQIMSIVLASAKGHVTENHLIISIAAGLPLSFFEQNLDSDKIRIIRVMPNTPALVLAGASALSGNSRITDADMQLAQSLFNGVGKAVVLEERYLDAVTGLSGSGPAYVFTFIEAMIDAGIKEGLTRPVAETLVLQTISGSVKLVEESGKHPAELRAMVTSPGGTTIAGQHILERKGFRGIIMDAVSAASKRSTELGKNQSNCSTK